MRIKLKFRPQIRKNYNLISLFKNMILALKSLIMKKSKKEYLALIAKTLKLVRIVNLGPFLILEIIKILISFI